MEKPALIHLAAKVVFTHPRCGSIRCRQAAYMVQDACFQEVFVDPRIKVRRAVPADAEAIGHVARVTWNAAYAGIILAENRERLLARWYAPNALRDSITQQDSWLYVAVADDQPVGFAQFVMRKDGAGQLTRIYVLPDWQRKTIGTLLLQEGLAALSRQGAHEVFVQVEKDNRVGKAFYEKKGFRFSREFSMQLPEQRLVLEELVLQIHDQESGG
jgi:ribosomal protein S18 acetylase RimI-like enzyme